ncbi:MAG: hypothetical protein KGD74_07780 [Candidatus Lokiarchaeota archaeon]|nr:hypothetical protein [Candidatus Lokiarchaeota archaeon]
MESKFKICPRCKGTRIIDIGDTIDCPDCRLEFEKADIKVLESDQILAISEKLDFIRGIKNKNNRT